MCLPPSPLLVISRPQIFLSFYRLSSPLRQSSLWISRKIINSGRLGEEPADTHRRGGPAMLGCARKSANPARKSATPARKSANPARKSATPARKSAKPARKSAAPARKSANPARAGWLAECALWAGWLAELGLAPVVIPVVTRFSKHRQSAESRCRLRGWWLG